MLCNLNELIAMAAQNHHGLAAFNVYDYEDAKAVVNAAEKTGRPVVLMTNKLAVSHMDMSVLAGIMINVAESTSAPVGVHLDHATDLRVIKQALDLGYSSVMFDGSQLPFAENVKLTRAVVEMAHPYGASVEAEIGAVGYSDKTIKFSARLTDPDEAKQFAYETGTDALAVAVGTVHRMETQGVSLQFDLLSEIHNLIPDVPLVIHGATGVSDSDLRKLIEAGASKINIGTSLRLKYGEQLRKQFEEDSHVFDRIVMYEKCAPHVEQLVMDKIMSL